ncbi:MAG: phosphatidate cytidylyltransferase [Magnetococcales bacterium]|nr:phosphatidate cytidylyltransferase [Magnetococcales bacterium]
MIVRSLSALVLIPLLLWLLLAGTRDMLFVLLLVASGLLLWEWLALRSRPVVLRIFLPLLGAVWVVLGTGYGGRPDWIPLELAAILFALLVVGVAEYQRGRVVSDLAGFRFMGVLYCGLPLLLVDSIRAMEHGGRLICLLLFVIWATDTGALLAGRTWGGGKLAPDISPNKTWAGFWGGILLGALTGLGLGIGGFVPVISPLAGGLLGVVLSFAGQIGDLVESVLKREAGVKDTGNLIPGHGGLLDRLDSLLFAIPIFALYLRLGTNGVAAGASPFGP